MLGARRGNSTISTTIIHINNTAPSSTTLRLKLIHYNQDIQGPLSAGVIEGHRAFPSFHGSFHSRTHQAPTPTSYPNLSVADILERYQDANKDFLVSILNAKAKEDERKTEEERYKTEQVRLQSKQLELDLALEKRRGSPPAAAASGRSYATNSTESANSHYSTTTGSYRSSYSSFANSTPSSATVAPPPAEPYSRQSQHDHNMHSTSHASQEAAESSSKHGSGRHHPYQDQTHLQPSPQSRPPSLKINTAVRQSYPKQQHPLSSQRGPVSPQHGGPTPLPSLSQQGPNSSKSTGRHFNLPALSTSAHSSPVANIDYQSHIPPPLTPKDEHVSPTSILSPAVGQNLKRKSVHHDAVMDAVRAKVLRNAGQSQQREREQQQQQLHKKSSIDAVNRRKTQHSMNGSPERAKKAMESNGNGSSMATTMAGPKSKHGHGATSPSRQSYSEGGRSTERASDSPTSPSTPVSANAGSGQSRSCSPPSAVVSVTAAGGEVHPLSRSPRKDSQNGYSKVPSIREESRSDSLSSAEDEKAAAASRYEMDRSRAERSSEIGGK
ncbi:hypothetical protein BGX27_008698 [Mortierella sp. AM989]|nr:hypothetical protein BGX27_008698 [Mortierella sp. AM989]